MMKFLCLCNFHIVFRKKEKWTVITKSGLNSSCVWSFVGVVVHSVVNVSKIRLNSICSKFLSKINDNLYLAQSCLLFYTVSNTKEIDI